MPDAAMTAALWLASTAGHRPRGAVGIVLVLVFTAVVIWYFRRRRGSDQDRDQRR
ncbi:MAG TPA: hypothetical protein VHX66_11450 [Solirubrobacteraceae bacterium]|nr:hypothetical protein [Solirubrobacteraceae bacterium]